MLWECIAHPAGAPRSTRCTRSLCCRIPCARAALLHVVLEVAQQGPLDRRRHRKLVHFNLRVGGAPLSAARRHRQRRLQRTGEQRAIDDCPPDRHRRGAPPTAVPTLRRRAPRDLRASCSLGPPAGRRARRFRQLPQSTAARPSRCASRDIQSRSYCAALRRWTGQLAAIVVATASCAPTQGRARKPFDARQHPSRSRGAMPARKGIGVTYLAARRSLRAVFSSGAERRTCVRHRKLDAASFGPHARAG